MAIWILTPDQAGTCCGCEGKTSPCDSCGCPLPIPLTFGSSVINFGSYIDLATAQAALVSYTSNCAGYIDASSVSSFTFSANTTITNQLTLTETFVGMVGIITNSIMWASVKLQSGTILTANWSFNFNNADGSSAAIFLYRCSDGIKIDSRSQAFPDTGPSVHSGTFTINISDTGDYILYCNANSGNVSVTGDTTFTISSSSLTKNTIVAIYSGGQVNC